jgi:hypothetical protein
VKRVATALALAALTLTSACGGDTTDAPVAQDTPTAKEGTTTPSVPPTAIAPVAQDTPTALEPTTSPVESPTAIPNPEYSVVSESDLEAALLTIQDMPVGYSQMPPSETSTKTFCDYKPPFTEQVHVRHDFIKGGGMSAELLVVRLRQYESADQARASFDALTQALSTCHTETIENQTLEYAAMSAPEVGEESVGLRATVDGGMALLQNFALVGPTIVTTGGGGLMQADADEIARLLEAQVDTYAAAAAK